MLLQVARATAALTPGGVEAAPARGDMLVGADQVGGAGLRVVALGKRPLPRSRARSQCRRPPRLRDDEQRSTGIGPLASV
jgi:hypothetical protein